MHPMINIAIKAARKAGILISRNYETKHFNENNKNKNNSFFNKIHFKAEQLIFEVIKKFYPKHEIINEKSNWIENTNYNIQWLISSIDGKINFTKNLPYFAISISVRIKGRIEVVVIHDPIRNELFFASRGQGAQLNCYKIRCNTLSNLNNMIISIKYPVKKNFCQNNYCYIINKLSIYGVNFRCTGSSILDLAYVASGRLDGFFESGLKLQEFAGGDLLVRESGGLITDFTGGNDYLLSGNIIAGNPSVIKSILEIIRN